MASEPTINQLRNRWDSSRPIGMYEWLDLVNRLDASHGTSLVLAKKLAAVSGRNWQEWYSEAAMEWKLEKTADEDLTC